jgi:hypothetical protein
LLTNLLISLPVKERRELTGRVPLHRRQDVRISVERRAYLAVPESLLHNLRRHTSRQKQSISSNPSC